MKLKSLLGLSLMALTLPLVTACSNPFSQGQEATYASVSQSQDTPEAKAKTLVKSMSNEEKVGQLLIFGVYGTEANDDSKYMINSYHPAGIILFDRNMKDPDQVKTLIGQLKDTSKANSSIPLFMAIDQEGGAVTRMADSLVQAPPAQVLGTESVDKAVDWAQKSGKELKDLGFNLNFAPDADMGLTYGRSYSSDDPSKVVEYAYAVGQAYHDQGLFFAYKHFPGIGKTDVDLHADSSRVTASKEVLMNNDAKVFQDLIGKTESNQYMVMVSHAIYPALDSDNPASLSKAIMVDLLRNQFNYQGVVIIDDLEMGALANHYSFGDMAVKSVNAGGDLLLVCQDYGHMREVYKGLLEAVTSGTISQDRLDQAVTRVLTMKLSRDDM